MGKFRQVGSPEIITMTFTSSTREYDRDLYLPIIDSRHGENRLSVKHLQDKLTTVRSMDQMIADGSWQG